MNAAAKPEVVVIADDLTGGADTGVQFCPVVAGGMYLKHYTARTLACEEGLPAGLSIFTNSRHVAAKEAGRRVAAAIADAGSALPRLIYKKVDSCLRGNIGAELDALMQHSGAETSFVAPALPAQGRTTRDDVHLLNGVPVALTEMGRDPLCPVKESRISVLLGAQSDVQVGHVGHEWIDRGVDELEKRFRHLRHRGCRHIVFDALCTDHLQTIADLACRRMRSAHILLAGSAGLASALAEVTAPGGKAKERFRRPAVRRWLFVCGSASQVMRRQVEYLTSQANVPHTLFHPEEQGGISGEWIESFRRDDGKTDPGSTGLVMSLAPVAGAAASPMKPQTILAALAAKAASALGGDVYDGLFLSGGDTAEAVLDQIGAEGVCLQVEILPGLVLGTIVGGDCTGLPVVTKAGAFGGDRALLELIQQLI